MSRNLGAVTYYGLSPNKLITTLASVTIISLEDDCGEAEISVIGKLAPDLLELRIKNRTITMSLLCLFLPVDTNSGPACQIGYRWSREETYREEKAKHHHKEEEEEEEEEDHEPEDHLEAEAAREPEVSDKERIELASSVVYMFDRKLRQSGAKRITPHHLITVVGDSYSDTTVLSALKSISDLVCLYQQLRDASGAVVISWYGSLTWSSPRTGMIAANFHYTMGGTRKRIFVRWHLFWSDSSKSRVTVHYDCSTPNQSLSNKGAMEWEIIKELIRQTSQRLCTSGATRLSGQIGGQRAVVIGADSTVLSLREVGEQQGEFRRTTYWPSLQEFSEAMQNIQHCIFDEQLRNGKVHYHRFGLPYVVSGAFNCVYRVHCGKRVFAVRCFSTPVRDQAERFRRMSTFICSDNLPYTLDFHYLEQGILCRGQWFPIVKMEWVEGESLSTFIEQNFSNPQVLTSLRIKLWLMLLELAREGVAHGDLQHGNIIIRDDQIVLVDYDGMFVKGLEGYPSREKGHPNYQHPARGEQHFGPYLDNFSAWLIDTALLAISEDPSLWEKFHAGDECLLFRRSDLVHPHHSELFSTLENHQSMELNRRAEYLRMLLAAPVERIPPLAPGYPDLVLEPRSAKLPDWLVEASH